MEIDDLNKDFTDICMEVPIKRTATLNFNNEHRRIQGVLYYETGCD